MKYFKLGYLNLSLCLSFTAISICSAFAQDTIFNYDETKVPPYTLPDPLLLPHGKRITTVKKWMQQQRSTMLQLFAENVYGRFPGPPKGMRFVVKAVDSFAVNGKAIRKQVTVFFSSASDAPFMEVLLYLPKNAKVRVPVFTGLNFYGNQTVSSDSGILFARKRGIDHEKYMGNNTTTERSRGSQAGRWQVEELINHGYGLATAYCGDLEPDYPGGWKTGVRTALKDELGIREEEWGAIGAWAWGLCRIMDYLETDISVNPRQVVITGHSRLGKAALWAAANDTRFAIVVSNNSGEGGAALARRRYGETIKRLNTSFPHWFVTNYKRFNDKPELLPVDQHILLALMAPRPLYVASAEADKWSDPKGEFLSAKKAEPVYALFGKKGLGTNEMPAIDHPVGETIKYHIRTGQHNITLYDWQQYINFADKQFKK